MSGPSLTVVIPTYNRANILKRVLYAYSCQINPLQISEILVVDDGSGDDTPAAVLQTAQSSSVPIRYLRQKNSGAAAARNHGIRETRTEIVLMVDDDILPATNMVAEHLAWHKQNPNPAIAVVGYVPYSPEVHPTPLMRWWGLDGLRFTTENTYWATGPFFNTSMKVSFLRENGLFDERFRQYGYQDLELGYRLIKRGMRVLYNPHCVGYHYKKVRFNDVCRHGWIMATSPMRQLFESTEAGQDYVAKMARRRTRWKYRIQNRLVWLCVPLLSPLRPLLDSHVPLPGPIYEAFYAYHAGHEARQKRTRRAQTVGEIIPTEFLPPA
jgi:glycosyltransferase involved in cell wall biosynthesis